MMSMMSNGMTISMIVWMAAWTALLIGLLAVGIGLLARGTRPARVSDGQPEEILRRRYAAGEIGEDKYLTRLSGISQR